MKEHRLSLEPLTLLDVQARKTVDIASRVGFDYVSMVLHEPVPLLPADPIVTDLTLRAETLAAMRAAGVRLNNIECFNLTPDVQPGDFAAGLSCGHALGALTATAIVKEPGDRSGALAKYRRLCDMAAELDIRVNIEFFAAAKAMCTLDMAVAFVRDSGRANAGVTLDILHVIRTGSSIADILALDPELIGGAQICDGPLVLDAEQAHGEATGNRLAPGTGAFPLKEFVAALPSRIVIGVEAPQASLIGKVAPQERARTLLEATRDLYRD
jgi:sugar phosphate isomerase/epimerase